MTNAYVIISAILAYLLSTDIFTPSMPDIARHFNESPDDVQRTVSYFLLGAVTACIFAGIFADQVGKKKYLLYGLLLGLLGSFLTIFAPTLDMLVLGRFIQGLGGGVAPVLGFAMVQELYQGERQAYIYGLMGLLLTSIPALAPLLGGIISTHYGWHVIFGILGVIYGLSTLLVWWALPESLNNNKPTSSREIFQSYKMILSNRMFIALAMISPLYNAVEWFAVTFLPFYMQDHIGLSAELYGLYLGILICWFGIGSIIGGKFIAWWGIPRTINIGLATGVLSALMLWVTTGWAPLSTFWIMVDLSMFFWAFGVLFPSSVNSTMSVFPEAKTRASSVRSLMVIGVAFLGSFGAEWVDDSKLASLATTVSISCGLAVIVYILRGKTSLRPPS